MLKEQPKVSIVMSCYNAESTLQRAVNSILDQTFTDFELIIIDDASSDQTSEILNQYALNDTRIQLVTNEKNQGLSYSLNKGIKIAQSQIIARMDADDYAYPDRILKQYEFLLTHKKVDILGSAVRYLNEDGEVFKSLTLPTTHEHIVHRIFKKTIVFHPTIMLRKQVYENHGYYDPKLRWAEDADLWYRIYDQVTFHNLQEILLDYTVKSSISNRILCNNIRVKWDNLRKRGLVLSHLPYIMRDLITLSLRRVKNY